MLATCRMPNTMVVAAATTQAFIRRNIYIYIYIYIDIYIYIQTHTKETDIYIYIYICM